jgi:CBS domain-containing protein
MDWKLKKAKDVMKKQVVAVRPTLLIQELANLFDDRGISGAPVINRYGHLVGVVSKTDLVRHNRDGETPHDRFSFYKEGTQEFLPKGFHLETPDRTEVAEIMTPAIIQAKEETPVPQLARVMRRKHIHRIFITNKKKLLGVVTTMDLLRLMEGGARTGVKKKSKTKKTAARKRR